ncbi:hypothetical protein SDC9_192415 [bioreactor metagenome]|uniref:Arginine--tRNA ligase n=1 Tax=bioreactor metagenome TaxID=1076179 RepID=A0A645I0S0_9ZZZZ
MPDDGDDYRNLSLYLRMAEVFDKAYGMTYDLQYLNVLLKLSDILIAYKETLAEREKGRLAWLIERLLGHVRTCAQKIGVSLCI